MINEVQTKSYLPVCTNIPNVHPEANIINSQVSGNVFIEEKVFIINAVIRADEGTPFYISKGSNIQDFATLHAYFTQVNGDKVDSKLIQVENKGDFAIFIGENVSISHGVLIHGPVFIDNMSFIGFKSTVESSRIGKNVEIGAHSYIANVTIPDNTGIAPGSIITNHNDIEKCIIPLRKINSTIVDVNLQLLGYYMNNKKLL